MAVCHRWRNPANGKPFKLAQGADMTGAADTLRSMNTTSAKSAASREDVAGRSIAVLRRPSNASNFAGFLIPRFPSSPKSKKGFECDTFRALIGL